jgi:hypothetical protein
MAFDITIGSADQPDSGFDIVIGDEVTVAAPGSTITALNAGGIAYKWVAAIEGYERLLTDATPAQAIVAWAAHPDYAAALGGLTVDLSNEQRIGPWDPFPGGGKLSLYVSPDPTYRFQIDTHRSAAGDETILDATLDCNDTTVTVRSTTDFAASGHVYIGTEAIEYTAKGGGGITFTGGVRGKWSPFPASGSETERFAHPHLVVNDANNVQGAALVTERQRTPPWLGKWVGLWMHRYDHENGLLNVKGDARCVFAGRTVEVRHDPATMNVVVECEHVLDYVKSATLGTNQYTARVKDGIYLSGSVGHRLDMADSNDRGTAVVRNANPLIVKVGASGVNEIEQGIYTIDEIYSMINDWLAAERAASRLYGNYTIGKFDDVNGTRTVITWWIQGTANDDTFANFSIPALFVETFGGYGTLPTSGGRRLIRLTAEANVTETGVSSGSPLRAWFSPGSGVDLTAEQGQFEDQTSTLPADVAYQEPGLTANNAVFLIGGSVLASAYYDSAGPQLLAIKPITYGVHPTDTLFGVNEYKVTVDDAGGDIVVKQVFMIDTDLATAIKSVFHSTGTAGYNHATWDAFPRALSLAIPSDLLGPDFIASVDALPMANRPITIVLEKPKRIADIFGGDLMARFSFLRWKNGLQFCTWSTPVGGVLLDESNKASPAGNKDEQRSATKLTDQWASSVIKLNYNRDITRTDGEFRDSITVEDRVAMDDSGGGGKVRTIDLVNTYTQDVGAGTGVEDLRDFFVQIAPTFTRNSRLLSRTIDSRMWEQIAVGDTVTITDEFACDPDTGLMGVEARNGTIVRHHYTPGGARPDGSVADMGGEVEVMLREVSRLGMLAPAAQFDHTATNAGYVVATKVCTLLQNAHSETADALDDGAYFPAGSAVRILEIDPANPAAPSTHDDIVASRSGNTVTLTTGFAGWDNTKRYRLIYDDYGDAITAQRAAYAFQADATDGQVASLRQPYEYILPYFFVSGQPTFTANTSTDMVELPADSSYGDGVGRDVGHEVAINRLINNLIDYKTAHSMPQLYSTELSGSAATGDFYLVSCRVVNFGSERRSGPTTRVLSLAPHFKSSDGASASVRVSLCRSRPTGDDRNDINLGFILRQATFTTTSTTYATPTAVDIDISNIPDPNIGRAYLVIECSVKARTYGVAIAQEGPRS